MGGLRDILAALVYGTAIMNRAILAVAASLFVLFCLISPPIADTPYVLTGVWRWGWLGAFTLDAAALWWRLLSSKARPHVGTLVNLYTFALWVGITGGTVMTAHRADPGLVGYVVFCIVAFHALVRTELTHQDRETA